MIGVDRGEPDGSYTVWALNPLPDKSELTGALFGSWVMAWVIGLGVGPDEDDT